MANLKGLYLQLLIKGFGQVPGATGIAFVELLSLTHIPSLDIYTVRSTDDRVLPDVQVQNNTLFLLTNKWNLTYDFFEGAYDFILGDTLNPYVSLDNGNDGIVVMETKSKTVVDRYGSPDKKTRNQCNKGTCLAYKSGWGRRIEAQVPYSTFKQTNWMVKPSAFDLCSYNRVCSQPYPGLMRNSTLAGKSCYTF